MKKVEFNGFLDILDVRVFRTLTGQGLMYCFGHSDMMPPYILGNTKIGGITGGVFDESSFS